MYNLYSILKIIDRDVLLVRRLDSVTPALLPSRLGFKPHPAPHFLNILR
jgi:hypothetical protein